MQKPRLAIVAQEAAERIAESFVTFPNLVAERQKLNAHVLSILKSGSGGEDSIIFARVRRLKADVQEKTLFTLHMKEQEIEEAFWRMHDLWREQPARVKAAAKVAQLYVYGEVKTTEDDFFLTSGGNPEIFLEVREQILLSNLWFGCDDACRKHGIIDKSEKDMVQLLTLRMLRRFARDDARELLRKQREEP